MIDAAIDAQKPLPKRLQEATQQAASAKVVDEKTSVGLQKAQEALRQATDAKEAAEATLAEVMAELSAPAPVQCPAPPDALRVLADFPAAPLYLKAGQGFKGSKGFADPHGLHIGG